MKERNEHEIREQKLMTSTITNTEHVIKTCGNICKTLADVDAMIARMQQAGDSIKEALAAFADQVRTIKQLIGVQ